MNLDLYIDTAARRLVTGPDNAAAPRLTPFVQGDICRVTLHFLDPTGDPATALYRQIRPAFTSIKLGLGYIDRPPTGGSWQLRSGAHTTPLLGHAITKPALQAALNALPPISAAGGIEVEPTEAPNIHLIRWINTTLPASAATLEVAANQLSPHSFIRLSRHNTVRGWLHTIKLFQSPVAFSDQFAFPPPPAVTCATARSGTGARSTVWALIVPDGATGSFDLTWQGLTTVILPIATLSPSAIEAALNNLFADGQRRFAVTQPRRATFYIECVGPLALAPHAPPAVAMHDQEQVLSPATEFSLAGPGIEWLLDGRPSVNDLTLECEITTTNGETSTLFQTRATLLNDMIDEPMALLPDPQWLDSLHTPSATVDYNPDQAVIGMLGYQDFAGDGIATAWTYTHHLGTANVHITVRDNTTGLRIPDNLYTAEILNTSQVRITFPAPPAPNQYVVIISAANAEPHYQPHTHPITEITGLQDALNALSAAGNPLELWPQVPLDKLPMIPASKIIPPLTDAHIPANIPRLDPDGWLPLSIIPPEVPRLLPDGSLAVRSRDTNEWLTLFGPDGAIAPERLSNLDKIPGFADAVKAALTGAATAGALSFHLPSWAELYPGRAHAPQDPSTLDAGALPRPGGLLPAIHDPTVTSLTTPADLPAPNTAPGQVCLNNTGASLTLPGALGRRSTTIPHGGHLASDGRAWYPVRPQDSTTTFHPTDFERELLILDIPAPMLHPGGILTLQILFETQLLRTDIRAQWTLRAEIGAYTATPSPAGANLSAITWSPTPLLDYTLRLTKIRTPHTFGIRITRGPSAWTTETRLYRGPWTAAPSGSGPAAPGFAIRARLIQWDTEDSAPDPRGYLYLRFNPDNASTAIIL